MSGPAFQTFPGTSGFYASCSDVNLLDADTAHLEQSIGEWAVVVGSSSIIQSQALTPIFGNYHGAYTATEATSSIFTGNGAAATPVSAATEYTWSVYVAGAANAAATVEVRMTYFDSGGSDNGNSGYSAAVPITGEFVQFSDTHTTPAGTAYAAGQITVRLADVDDVIYFAAPCLRAGSDGSFVPSLRIVGDLDLRAMLAADDYTPTANQWIIGNRNGFDGYGLLLLTTGTWYPYHGDGSSHRNSGVSLGTLVNGTAYEVQVTFTQSDGKWRGYLDGELLYTTSATNTNDGSPSGDVMAVAASITGTLPFDGDMYWAESRDGIDGPRVARWDATQALGEAS